MNTPVNMNNQTGSMILEALIAILIFSMGILAIVGMQAASIKNAGDAKYRADASYLANQIISQIWADRTNFPTNYNSLSAACDPAGTVTGSGNVGTWLGDTSKPGTVLGSLPKAGAQIKIDTGNVVTVTLCWKAPQETQSHNFIATAQIQG